MQDRPTVVSFVAAFLFAATLIATVVGVSLLFPGTFLDRVWTLNKQAYAGFEVLGRVSGALLLLLGFCTATAGAGLLRGEAWARWFAVAILAVNGFGDVVNLLLTGDFIKSAAGALIAATFLFCLFRPNVAAFFQRRRETSNGPATKQESVLSSPIKR